MLCFWIDVFVLVVSDVVNIWCLLFLWGKFCFFLWCVNCIVGFGCLWCCLREGNSFLAAADFLVFCFCLLLVCECCCGCSWLVWVFVVFSGWL